jgi:DNA-binding SARP family transcriptional activator
MPTPVPDRDPPLSIRLFGALEVRLSGQPLPRLRSRKGEWLLALLVLRDGQPVLRDWLAETLWPDSSPEGALTSLRQSLKDLRSALGDQAWRLQKAGSRRLVLELSHARVDLHEFRALLKAGESESLARAVALYRGPLLEGCREPWLQADREQYERAYLGALERLSRDAEVRGDLALAAGYLRQAAAAVPGSEPVHRLLMTVLSRHGETQVAIEAYQRLRRWLHREYAAEPDAETTALYQQGCDPGSWQLAITSVVS